MKFRHAALALLSAVGCSAALAANPVTELQSSELAPFVRKHKLVAVQFTTPDRQCDYCIGADKTFDRAALLNTDPKMVFVRVWWPTYAHWPSDIVTFLKAIPAQMIYIDGKIHRRAVGKPDTPELMLKQFQDMVHQSADDRNDDKVYVHVPYGEPLTDDERRLVALQFRAGYLDRVVENCGKYFPDQVPWYRQTVAAWKGSRAGELLTAARTAHDRAGSEAQAIYDREQRAMGVLQVQTLNIPNNRAPRPDDCARVIDAIADLPVDD